MADGIARAGFDKDLRDGKAREDAFVHALLGDKVEIKSDAIARRTRRVFVEYMQLSRRTEQWEPSGIKTSTAHRWAFEVNDDCWLLVPAVRVKAIVRRLLHARPDLSTYGGDYNRYRGVLVPVEMLLWGEVAEEDVRAIRWNEADPAEPAGHGSGPTSKGSVCDH